MLAKEKRNIVRTAAGAFTGLVMMSLFASAPVAANTFTVEVGNRAIECKQEVAESGRGRTLTCTGPRGAVIAVYFLPQNGKAQVIEENGTLGERVTVQVRRLLGETD